MKCSCGVDERETNPALVVKALQHFLETKAKTAGGLCAAISRSIQKGYHNGHDAGLKWSRGRALERTEP